MVSFVFNSILLGIGLAMDAFSVSIANGLNEPNMRRSRECLIAGTYGFFQFLMPVVGWACVHMLLQAFKAFEKFIPWIALILLLWIGGKMILDAVWPEEKEAAEEETGFGEALEEEVSEWETPEAMDEADPAGSTGELLLSPEEEAAEEETGFGEGEALEEEAFGWKAAEEETAGWESSGEEAFGREASGEEAEGKSAGQSKESRPDEENRDYIPPVVTVHDGIMRITLPPESGILLRWSSLVSDPENK